MSIRILNIGSLNIDNVFIVPHIVSSGETLSCNSYQQVAGGKGIMSTKC